ncbi:glycosyltransferase family 4 protein [Polynucleobacter sp.]|jgi:starch synthase|uniref:glycosyltransferase family 4 protein n=1 Tax=Polynucleobacter sp. TaxID=2029855 RepID=UPI0037C7AD65
MKTKKSTNNCVIRIPALDSYDTSGATLMGRQSANEGFLTAWFKYTEHQEYWCMARYRNEAQVFAKLGGLVHSKMGLKPKYRWIAQNQINRASAIGTVYLPGPQVADIAWVRRRNSVAEESAFSIVGMTHTSCELSIQDALANMLSAPVYLWDAQICPSLSVKTMVQRLLDDESAWLRHHLGATKIAPLQLPILPLGVNLDAFTFDEPSKKQYRNNWRSKWQLTENDVCALYMGRLDMRTKANLYPMFDALNIASQKLAEENGPKVTLILAGWFASNWDEKTIKLAAAEACPNIKVIFEDGRIPDVRHTIWYGADLFTSLVDNIQETFGLTPIEAMASGLPVVVSDYDGYRESVRDGVDGFRIKTYHPPAGDGGFLMDMHADHILSYREYVNQASAFIGLNIRDAAQAYIKLAKNPELRSQMGAEGQKRAATYSWEKLIPSYQNLFLELQKIRESSKPQKSWNTEDGGLGLRHPRRSDPFHSFAHYPSEQININTILRPGPLLPKTTAERVDIIEKYLNRPVYQGISQHFDKTLLLNLINTSTQSEGLTPSLIHQKNDEDAKTHLLPQISWLIKAGLLEPQ